MAFQTGTATDYLDLLSKVVAFVTTANAVEAAVADGGNVGNGSVSQPTADDAAPSETWTLACTNATVPATFSVTGSVSGVQTAATSGVAYNDIVQFTITAGGTPWSVGDEFTFDVVQTLGALKWTELDNSTAGFTTNGQVFLQAPGLAGVEEIFVNIEAKSAPASNRFYWRLQGATSYNDALAFDAQLGAIPTGQGVPLLFLDDDVLSYRLAANGQRFVLVVYVGTVVESCYCGLLDRLEQPAVYPYPLFIGAMHWDETENFADTATVHSFFLIDFSNSSTAKSVAHLYLPGGVWTRLRDYDQGVASSATPSMVIAPNGTQAADFAIVPSRSGQYTVFPSVVSVHRHVYGAEAGNLNGECSPVGVLDGVGFVTGHGLTSGDLLGPSDEWEAFQNAFRTDVVDFAAIKRS